MPQRNLRGKFISINDGLWGDNGKGDVTRRLIKKLRELNYEVTHVFKGNGGGNSGHSCRNSLGKYFFSNNIPLAASLPNITAVLGPGFVCDMQAVIDEMERLSQQGFDLSNTLIDERVQIILPIYKSVERALEELKGKSKIGTTKKAIGPTYAFREFRFGVRFCDLLNGYERAVEKVSMAYELANAFLQGMGLPAEKFDIDQIIGLAKKLEPHAADTLEVIEEIRQTGTTGIIEHGQGALLDIIFGTYPYVTSSATVYTGLLYQLGLHPNDIGLNLFLAKLYMTRVGSGPFPTEDSGDLGKTLQKGGKETGVTTSRIRRCGKFCIPTTKHMIRMIQPDAQVYTKLDVLDPLDEIQVCTHWKYQGKSLALPPADTGKWKDCEPQYTTLPGWKQPTTDIHNIKDLPPNAQNFLHFIQERTHYPIAIVTNGELPHQTIFTQVLYELIG